MKIYHFFIVIIILIFGSCEFSTVPVRDTVEYTGIRDNITYTLVIDPIPNRATYIIGDAYTLTRKNRLVEKISSGVVEYIVNSGCYLRPSFYGASPFYVNIIDGEINYILGRITFDDGDWDEPGAFTGEGLTPSHVHNWGDWIQTIAPTCTTPGVDIRVCSHDAEHQEMRIGMAALGHDWSDWLITTPPTQTGPGVETRTCQRSDCNYTETRPAPLLLGVLPQSQTFNTSLRTMHRPE